MIAGRKLLVADDSIAIQKVVDLTFTDEGMEVITAGDGREAVEKLGHLTPDVVLADVHMPGVGGYELCRFVKTSEQLQGVPVMLLIGCFEPFDEAEAKNAGADDVVTKPFQSIRDLVSRVGSLVGHHDAARSVLGLSQPEETTADEAIEAAPASQDAMSVEQPDVDVSVDSPVMETQAAEIPEPASPPVIDLQTAETKKLEPILASVTDESVIDDEFADTVELQVVDESAPGEPAAEVVVAPPAFEVNQTVEAAPFDHEGVLDLGDIDSFTAPTVEEEFVLDVEVESVPVSSAAVATVSDQTSVASEFAEAQPRPFERDQEPALTRVTDEPEDEAPTARLGSRTSDLSPDAIEAISRRVVEQLSDKVVREIAWEVVPELSELLIKKRLEERQ